MRVELSVVIVTYNNASCIIDCLYSLHQASSLPIQVVLVDNASTDKTLSILKAKQNEWGDFFSDFHIIANNRNLGYTKGVNQGLRWVCGRFVLLLNPDVLITGNMNLLLEMLRNDIGIVAPQLRYPDGTIQPSCRRFPRRRDVFLECLGFSIVFSSNAFLNYWKMPDFDHLTEYENCQPQGAFLLTRKVVLEQVGLLDERFPMFFSDVDWCQRVIKAGYTVKFTPRTYMIHFKGKSIFQRRLEMIISSHRSFVQYFKKQQSTRLQKIGTEMVYLFLLVGTLPRLLLTILRES